MKREGIMVGEKFLPADIIEHVLNLRRLGVQKDIWNKEEELTIKMEFPEAKWAEYNKTMTPAITLEEVVFK